MQLVEIRDLDGPNLFALRPVIKLEVRLDDGEQVTEASGRSTGSTMNLTARADPVRALSDLIAVFHQHVGLDAPSIGVRSLDDPSHHALFFDWQWRTSALLIAGAAFDAIVGGSPDASGDIRRALERDRAERDQPLWVRDEERRIPAVGITGTNGKTTTTRLLSHLLRAGGKRPGWCSSTGVYIDGERVMEGDYTGPSGARRVLEDPLVEVGVLETARGGILLRGLGYESNDVGVFLNISADHLDLQGVRTIETLADVKSVVVQTTRPDGLVVLNADDPLVLRQRERVRAPVLLTSQQPGSSAVREHCAAGGRVVVRDSDRVTYYDGSRRRTLFTLDQAPVTYAGMAPHMVENALAAAGAALGLGLDPATIAEGMRTFRPDIRSNPGRLNVFRVDGRIVVVDYAHNESGLETLLRFTRALMAGEGRLAAIVGTAGDRQDDVLDGLGQIAGREADMIYIKENASYLRGRSLSEAPEIIRRGVMKVGGGDRIRGVFPGEHAAFVAAAGETFAGDAIAVMCVEEQLAIFRDLQDRGANEWQPDSSTGETGASDRVRIR